MKESKDVPSSVLVLIVTTNGDEEVAVKALRSGARYYLKKSGAKNILPDPGTQAAPGGPAVTVTAGQYEKIQQAVRLINENYRTDICLNDVAGEAGMSPSHFSRMFKKVMGLTYQDYLNGQRITKAKALLRSGGQRVADIAVSLGFADATGFGRLFKKLTGHTPSAYRSLPDK